jgi:membrane protein DedA with SNARE-associated domain
MTDWLPCFYAAVLIALGSVISAALGYLAGRWREQLWLLKICKPEH